MIKKNVIPMLLLLGVATFQFITMPAFFYPGDNFAIRAEAANWINTGKLGIDYSRRAELGGMLAERGQYFYENDEKQMFFSRYGFGDTLLFLPPYAIHKAIHGPAPPMAAPDSLLFVLNCYSVFWVTLSALLLYLMAGLFTSRLWIRTAFTLATLYATFCAHYLKQPLHENFQMTLSLVFFYFSLRFFLAADKSKSWWNIGVACLAAGTLVTTKSSFVLYFAALSLTILMERLSQYGKDFKNVIWKPAGNYMIWIGIPALLAIAVLLFSNTVRFGSPLNSGYGQWIRNGAQSDYFSGELLKKTLPLFLWKSGNHNIFLHFPLLFTALPGLFFLACKNKAACWFLSITSLIYFLMIACYSGWSGGWCYGPRHLIFILMGMGIASVCLLDRMAEWKPTHKWAAFSLCTVIAIYSVFFNFQTNRIQCFAYYQLSSIFKQVKIPETEKYFREYMVRGPIYRDIRLHAAGKQTFPPIKMLSRMHGSQQACQQLSQIVKQFGRPNYYFFREEK